MSGIRVRGERSNADAVSSAGARSVYQIIPATRTAVLRKYGVDAYAGPQQAALAAGYLLKESLERNHGSREAAVAEYHGGTDRRQHGPITRAYVGRVTGQGGSVGQSGQSTFERVQARREQAREAEAGPSLAKVYIAYRQGRMSPEQAAQFEHDVNAGAVLLPPGGKLKRTPAAPVLPAGVVRAYNDVNSGMTIEQRKQVDEDLREGIAALPRGAKLNSWRPMTGGEEAKRGLGIGLRAVIEGAGDVAGLVMNPVNALLNATGLPQRLTGGALPMANDPSVNVADMMGLSKPQFASEQMASAVERGATGGLLTYGAGSAGTLAKLPGAAGTVSRALAAAPIGDAVSGGFGGASAEGARQAGYGPTGQLVAGVVGGGLGIGGAIVTERAAGGFAGRRAAELPATTPREVVLDRAGELTEDGQELVARHGFTPDEIRQAYEDSPAPAGISRAGVERTADVVEAEGRVRMALEDVGRVGGRVELQNGETISLDANRPSRAAPEALAAAQAKLADARQELEVARAAAGRATSTDGPLPPATTAMDQAPVPVRDSGVAASPTDASSPGPGTRAASDRTREAEALGIPLTRGQATQDFAIQDTEQTLRAQASGEGDKARTFLSDQADKIREAATKFREAFGSTDMTRADRGRVVVDALRDLRDRGKKGINTLYREANAMGGDGLALDVEGIASAAKRALVEADVPDTVKNVIRQEMARYGMIGKNAVTAEDGLTTVTLSDGRKVQFYGNPEPLTVGNAEQFRKAISAQYAVDGPRKLSQPIKGAVDDAVEAAVEAAARNGGDGPVGEKLRQARRAVVAQKETFAAKDVVQRLVDWKKGTRTDNVLPEQAMREVLAGDVSNLRRMKAVLLADPTPTSRGAWRAIQAEGVGSLIDKAYTANSNLGGGPVATISGAKLNSEILRFGIPKLKILLDEADFDRLMSLRRVIGEATIPISGTTNPSGSAFKLMRFLAPMAVKFSGIPLVGPAVDVASGLVKQAKATAEASRTLAGMTSYGAEEAAHDTARRAAHGPATERGTNVDADEQAAGFIDALVDAARAGRIAAAVVASAPRNDDER
ncbi:lytic transglycosylase domain-containing protein [uncultured Sphingomonas sp.]|uniref:lytic transglycosylase domain-containing protein n=1 Tax=uncultured Sphingomonas sp. TaxID=158754 RepID=UPI0025D6D231|nr:lytic transglycosylase domain-containing protein [uncultured Sphingomonas sp.]